MSDRDELIAKARTWERDWGERRTSGLITALADLAESEGRRADEAAAKLRKVHAEYGVTEKMRAQVSALAQENARLINEVGLLDATAREQRQRAEVLARGIAAYRSGGYTQGQLWENEEGKAVT